MIGTCYLPLSELVAAAPKPDSQTGLYANGEDGKHEMKEFTVSDGFVGICLCEDPPRGG